MRKTNIKKSPRNWIDRFRGENMSKRLCNLVLIQHYTLDVNFVRICIVVHNT